MAMLASYGVGDAALTATATSSGIIAGKEVSDKMQLGGGGEAVAIALFSTGLTYAALKLRSKPKEGSKPQIPEEGEESIGLFASVAMAIASYSALTFFAGAGAAVQYAASAFAGTMAYSIGYEIALSAHGLAGSIKPQSKEKEEEEDEEEEEEDEEEIGEKITSTDFNDYLDRALTNKKEPVVYMC